MRILYLSQYFPPEVGATQARALEMASGLVAAGHRVTVLTEMPNHPSGVVKPAYRGRLLVREEVNGIRVVRVWVKASPVKSFAARILFYGSFSAGAAAAGLFATRGPFDVILASSPPLPVGAAALSLSWLRRIPLVFEVRDVWPEVAVELGELRNRFAVGGARRLADLCYKRSRRIVVVAPGQSDLLTGVGVPPNKVTMIPNGSNTDLFSPQPQAGKKLRVSLGLEKQFVLLCAGTMSIAYDYDPLLQAAAMLVHAGITLLFAGTGPRHREIQRRVEELGLRNVRFLGEVEYERLPSYLSMADLSVIPLRDSAHANRALPVRLFDSLACECPAIVVGGEEAGKICSLSGGGVVVPPASPEALATAVRDLAGQRTRLGEMGRKGRAFVAERYSRKDQAESLSALLRDVVEPARA